MRQHPSLVWSADLPPTFNKTLVFSVCQCFNPLVLLANMLCRAQIVSASGYSPNAIMRCTRPTSLTAGQRQIDCLTWFGQYVMGCAVRTVMPVSDSHTLPCLCPDLQAVRSPLCVQRARFAHLPCGQSSLLQEPFNLAFRLDVRRFESLMQQHHLNESTLARQASSS